MIDTSTEWDILSQVPGEKWFAARLYYGDGTKYLSIGSKDFELNDEKFLGIISNKPAIGGGFNILTREFQINSGMIEVINHIDETITFGELATTLGSGNDIGFENRRVDIRLIKEGITKFENGYPLLERGRMYRPKYGISKVKIKVEDNTKNRLGKLGNVTTQDDARSGFDLPPDSAGKIRPIIYGPKRWTINVGVFNNLTKEDWFPEAPIRFTEMVNLGGGYWLIEDHEIVGTPGRLDGDVIWARNPVSESWMQIASYTVISNSSAGVIVDVGIGVKSVIDFVLPVSVTNEGTSNFSNPGNSIDRDVATAATISIGGTGNNGILRYIFPDLEIPGVFSDARLMMAGDGDWGAMNELFVDGDLNKYYSSVDPTTFLENIGSSIDEVNANSIDLTFRVPAPGSSVDATIYDVYRKVFTTLSTVPNRLFWGGQGHAIGNWVDAAGRSSHFNFGDSGDPALNPATDVESVARGDMNLVNDDIDMDSFDQLSNDLSADEANFDIIKVTDFKRFLSQMARQFRSVVDFNTGSKLFMKIIENEYASADVIINYNDITDLKFGRTDDDQQASSVVVEYAFDGSAYLAVTDEVTDAAIVERYDLNDSATKKELKADKIGSEACAELFRDFEFAFWKQPHNTIDKIGLDESFMKYTSGDIIRLEDIPDDQLPNGEDVTKRFTKAGQDILPYFMITGFKKSDRAIYEGVQMHDTTPAP